MAAVFTRAAALFAAFKLGKSQDIASGTFELASALLGTSTFYPLSIC